MTLPGRLRGRVWLAFAAGPALIACLAGCAPAPIQAVAVSDQDLTRGLLAHWSFDDQTGATVADHSGNGQNGQVTGGSWVAGRFGGGLRLQTSDSVTFPTFPQLMSDWTVSVWIYLSVADRASIASYDRAVLLTDEKAAMGGWEIEFDPRPGFEYLEASYYVAPPTGAYVILNCRCIETDRWMHFTAVFDSTNNRFSLYHGSLFFEGTTPPAPILQGQPELYVGRWAAGPRPISGVIDDYAIWSRALTSDEVAAIDAKAVPNPL